MTDIRSKIAKSLIANKLGLSAKELAEEHGYKVLQINGSLGQMMNAGLVEKGEKLEIEGQVYLISEKGLLEYASKIDLNEKVESDMKTQLSEDEIKVTRQNKLNTNNFRIWEIIDRMGAEFVELLSEQKNMIENKDEMIRFLDGFIISPFIDEKSRANFVKISNFLRG